MWYLRECACWVTCKDQNCLPEDLLESSQFKQESDKDSKTVYCRLNRPSDTNCDFRQELYLPRALFFQVKQLNSSCDISSLASMSRNPYLAASRPTSSFTRSSRTSKRSDLSSSRVGGGLLGRSRSSVTLGGGLSSHLGSTSSYSSSYVPSTSSWQRSSSSTRLSSRPASDSASTSIANSANKSQSDYTESGQNQPSDILSIHDSSNSSLYRSTSSQNLADSDYNKDLEDDNDSSVLFL